MSRCLLVFLGFLLFFTACQKEASFEQGRNATGALQDSLGDCFPKVVGGSYRVGQSLGDTNYIEVTVNVLTTGNYTIATDTVNGYSFRGTGTFNNAGPATVRLRGSGIPRSIGADNFLVIFDSTSCLVPITVVAGGASSGNSAFSLAGAPGTCTTPAIGGTYTQGSALTAANTVTFNVNVTTPGTWSITTPASSGFSFSGSGNFTTTGAQTITLTGSGTPAAAGSQAFTITAGTSNCTFNIPVVAGGGPTGCGTAAGTYTAGTALAAANTVTAQHTFATAGTYSVSTNTVNGFSFGPTSVTVTAAQAGTPVNISLPGTGTPTAAGTNTFTLNYGNGQTCTFQVTTNSGTAGPGTFFPLTANSWWSYTEPNLQSDTLKRTASAGNAAFGGNTYRLFIDSFMGQAVDTLYFRKNNNDYFEYNIVDYYSTVLPDVETKGAILFLREGLAAGATWNSADFNVTVSGQPVKIRYVFTVASTTGTATLNGRTYNNVYVVNMKSQFAQGAGAFVDDGLNWVFQYARDVGMITQRGTYQGQTVWDMNIKNYRIF